jgi:PAS domain S-box-containing protein
VAGIEIIQSEITQSEQTSDVHVASGSANRTSDTGPNADTGKGNRLTIRFRLACLVLACVLPVWLAAGILVYYSYQGKRALVEHHMQDTARALALVVDRELANMQAGLRVLATSPSLASGNMAAFYSQTQAVIQQYPAADIILADASGQQLVNSFLPFGTPLPKRNDPAARRVFESGSPHISNLFKGAVTGRPLVGMDMPVFRDGRVAYGLFMTVPADRLAEVLSQQHLPPEWIGAISDNDRVIVARTAHPEESVGKHMSAALLPHLMKTTEGTAEYANVEGVRVFGAFSRSAVSGWTVVIAVPKAILMAELWKWLRWVVAATALLSIIGLSLALLLGRSIAWSIGGLIAPALALGRGEPITVGDLEMKETNEVAASLVKVSGLLQQRVEERAHAEATRRQAEELRHFNAELDQRNAVLRGINTILEQALKCDTDEELGMTCLAVAEKITGSKFGFIAEIGPDGLLHDIAISDPGWDLFAIRDQAGHRRFPSDFKIHGLYGRILLDGKGFFSNDPAALPSSIGTPENHPNLTAFLGVPLTHDGKVMGMIAVGNRESGYRVQELQSLEALSPAIVEAFYRSRAEAALRTNEARLRLALDAAKSGTWEWDLRSNTIQWSYEVWRLFGLEPASLEPSYENWLLAVHPDDRAMTRRAVDTAAGRATEINVEYRVPEAGGGVRWLMVRGRPLYDSGGYPSNYTGIVMDITERKRAEQELVAAKELAEKTLAQLRATIDSMTEGMFVITPDRKRPLANPAYFRIYGFEPDSSPDAAEKVASLLERYDLNRRLLPLEEWPVSLALRGEIVVQRELRIRRTDTGREMITSVNCMPVRDASGEVVMAVITVEDITAKKRAEQALIRSEKLASVGRMAATIAHEINNPLEAVMNALFLAKSVEAEASRQYLDIAEEELRRIAHITRQSLGFYRESNAPALLSVNAVLDSAVDLLKSKVKAKQATVEKQWDEEIQITGVGGELRQVFSNLVANSLDAIEEHGTIKLRVSRNAFSSNGHRYVRVTVADDGKGIAADALPHLFEPFFTTKGAVGTGLGLWVSKQIIDNHGGSIRVRSSTEGIRRGTVFSVVVPVEPIAAAARGHVAGA